MTLAAQLSTERLQGIMHELFNRMAAVVQRYRGTVDKFTGDGLMALFGAPTALEDHALRACIAALELQSQVTDFAREVLLSDNVDLRVRVGLNSGEVIAGEIGSGPGRYTAVGHPVGIAQRMEAAAPAGGVLCSLSTARLVEDSTLLGPVEPVTIKNSAEPVPTRRLLGLHTGRAMLGRSEGELLGRDAEFDRLTELFASDGPRSISVTGAPGLGKTRLVREFLEHARSADALAVVERCESHTTGVAFSVLSRLLRNFFDVEDVSPAEARDRIAARMEWPSSQSPDAQTLFTAMGIADDSGEVDGRIDSRRRRLAEIMAEAVVAHPTPTIFVIDDAHWIDAASDDVLGQFCQLLAAESRALVLVLYRPDFTGVLHQTCSATILLEALPAPTAAQLAQQVLGSDPSLLNLGDRIAAAAAGNPFFIEEIVRDLSSREVLQGGRGNYRLVADIGTIAVPATVQAVLSARIDRLPVHSKALLNAASVIGSEFDLETLQALTDPAPMTHLDDLVAAELLDQTEFVPVPRYCFHHPLVRTVAYESQLTSTRAGFHRRLAGVIGSAPAAEENSALIATHLEAAGDLAEAYQWHMRAGDWLRNRDLAAARAEWESAGLIADRLPDQLDGVLGMRIEPRSLLTSTMLYVGNDQGADARFAELRELTARTGDLQPLALGMTGRMWSLTINDSRLPEATSLADELDVIIAELDCPTELVNILLIGLGYVRFADFEFDRARAIFDRIRSTTQDSSSPELTIALILTGQMDLFSGHHEMGKRLIQHAVTMTRLLGPVDAALMMAHVGVTVALGLLAAQDVIDDLRSTLTRADDFGDITGIIAARWAYGTVALRMDDDRGDEAITMLRSVYEDIDRYSILTPASITVRVDLAVDSARGGGLDAGIDDLRQLYSLQTTCGVRPYTAVAGEALADLLIQRGTAADLSEVQWLIGSHRRAGTDALDLWRLKCSALLARARGDESGYAALAESYLRECLRCDASGRIAEATRMAA